MAGFASVYGLAAACEVWGLVIPLANSKMSDKLPAIGLDTGFAA